MQIAPAYKGIMLGIGDSALIKAIAESTGRSEASVRSLAASLGDLGLAAKESRSKQKMMRTPAPLTVEKVYSTLHSIALMSGHAVWSTAFAALQLVYHACY
jgi:DNA ligase 1